MQFEIMGRISRKGIGFSGGKGLAKIAPKLDSF